ncbi:thiopeptide-type bacteriocin biosynthesis protein [Streptomyces sp. NPDC056544]|uniref:lantibiotic dehydratase n=1 Tax=unclassified Streptomyces TaxID=2593676 RepID=UPI0036806EEE
MSFHAGPAPLPGNERHLLANCQAVRRGDSIALLRRSAHTSVGAAELTLPATRLVESVLAAAREAVPEEALLRRIAEVIPSAPHQMRQRFLDKLLSLGFLLHVGEDRPVARALDAAGPGAEPILHEEVRAESEKALAVLSHIFPPTPDETLKEFHRRFVETYGVDSAVPLLDVVDDHRGIGLPDCYLAGAPARTDPVRPDGATGAVLASLVHEAVATGRREVELGADPLAHTPRGGPGPGPEERTPVLPLTALLCAAGPWTGDGEDFLLHEPEAGTSEGWRYLTSQPRAHERFPMPVPVVHPGTTAAQGPCIVVDVAPFRPDDLSLTTIGLMADAYRVHVVHLEDGTPLMPVPIDDTAEETLPPLARLLLALGRSGTGGTLAWEWGTWSAQPFLPRVRHGRTVLTRARWKVPRRLGALARSADGDWCAAVRAWQERFLVPDVVHVPHPRPSQRATREVPIRSEEFRRLLVQEQTPYVVESLEDSRPGRFVTTRSLQLLLDAPRSGSENGSGATVTSPRSVKRFTRSRHLPGGEWLYVVLGCPRRSQPSALTHLHDSLVDVLEDAVDRWFFVRYQEKGGGQLRLRFHGRPDRLFTEMLPPLRDTVSELHRAGLVGAMTLETYDQEVDRYGGTTLIADAERVFAEDSQAVLRLWKRYGTAALPWDAATAGTADLVRAFDPSLDSAAWIERVPIAATDEGAALRANPTPGQTLPAAQRFGELLRASKDSGHPAVLARINESLVHMHCNRLFGVDPDSELRVTAALHRVLGDRRAAGDEGYGKQGMEIH